MPGTVPMPLVAPGRLMGRFVDALARLPEVPKVP
jgi:hypothetical protein